VSYGDSLCGGLRTRLVRSRVLPPASVPTQPAPDFADRPDLTFNVAEDGPVTVSLQPLVNERAKHQAASLEDGNTVGAQARLVDGSSTRPIRAGQNRVIAR